MGETQVIFNNTKFAAREETTAGTAIAEQAASSILLAATGLDVNIGKETLENPYMSGSLTKTTPAIGMDSDDAGLALITTIGIHFEEDTVGSRTITSK